MNYQKYVKRISEALAKYKEEIDTLESLYNAECQRVKAEADNMKGKWTEEYRQQYIAEHNPDNAYKTKFQSARAKVEPILLDSLDRLHNGMDKYFNAPVKSDFANKIMAIKLSGLQLSDVEFKILQDSATSYMEIRLLNQLAETRTKKGELVEIDENGEGHRKEVDVKVPYTKLDLPNIEETYRIFDEYKTSVNSLLYSYSGTSAGMSHLLDKQVPKHISATMDNYFRLNKAEELSSVMEKANAILPEIKVKRELTENDKKLIDLLVDSSYPSLAKKRVIELADADEDIGNLLALDDRYKEYLTE